MKYLAHPLSADGWTDWIQPRMRSYRMSCCDCGLVHELQFRVVACGRGHKVIFRARRHERATAAVRRHRKGKTP